MKLKTLLGLAFIAGSGAQAADEWPVVPVSLQGSRTAMMALTGAAILADSMFASAGIKVHWLTTPPDPATPNSGAIVLQVTTGERLPKSPAALAYAKPYANGGTRITVFWDQVQVIAGNNLRFQNTILAHVLVHEITHVLQRMARHSETGVMRAVWSSKDYFEMKGQPLPFTTRDIELIHRGLNTPDLVMAESR